MAEAEKVQSKVAEYKPVPRSVAAWVRKTEFHRTLNDLVEDVHLALVDKSQQYVKYLDAVHDEQAVEGSLAADNIMAAQMIREEAKNRNMPRLAEAKLATIVKGMGVVLRRYHMSRQERRNMIGGEVVPNGNGE